MVLLAVLAAGVLRLSQPAVVQVSTVTGSSQVFDSRGGLENMLEAGARLRAESHRVGPMSVLIIARYAHEEAAP